MNTLNPAWFAGLPVPTPGRLTTYFLGPGFGESQVVSLPDGKWMVVDCFLGKGGINWVLALLQHFQAHRIDLLDITHADLDHYEDVVSLFNFGVDRLWRYPGFTTRRQIVLALLKRDPSNRRYLELAAAVEAMNPYLRENRGKEVKLEDGSWRPEGASYEVTCIAPCEADIVHESERLCDLLGRALKGEKLTDDENHLILGQSVTGHANSLSTGLVIHCDGGPKILLGGDIEQPPNTHRGWAGVIESLALADPPRLALMQDFRLVKVAHHGSAGAFLADAWREHAKTRKVDLAVISPFNAGTNPPPHAEVLRNLHTYVHRLALTAPPGSDYSLVTSTGWKLDDSAGRAAAKAPCIAVVFDGANPPQITVSSSAALFV